MGSGVVLRDVFACCCSHYLLSSWSSFLGLLIEQQREGGRESINSLNFIYFTGYIDS